MPKSCYHFDIKFPSANDGCSFENCCHKIVGKTCDEKMRTKLCTPLEKTFPQLVGSLDQEQLELIKSGAKPVVLVENASELFALIKESTTLLETVLQYIIAANKGRYKFVGSHNFPTVVKFGTDDPDGTAVKYGKNEKTKRYDKTISDVKKLIGRSKNVIAHVAIEIPTGDGEEVGHYGIIVSRKIGKSHTVIVFDSMQHSVNGTNQGAYTSMFSQIAKDLFNTKPTISVNPNVNQCLQITGGFVSSRQRGESRTSYLKRLQDMDSQNHFCYMWAIWYAHLLLIGGQKLADKTIISMRKRCIHPLVVIKKYIWSILVSQFPSSFSEFFAGAYKYTTGEDLDKSAAGYLAKFFSTHFRYVWDNLDTNQFYLFSVITCDMNKFADMTINDCLRYSIGDVTYVLDNFCLLNKKKNKVQGNSYVEK